jgi:hypothetical protein
VKFGAAENGVSLGRYSTSAAVDFTALSGRTFGQDSPSTVAQFRTGTGLTNTGPKVGPVVVSEIMYRSLASAAENPNEEFIELQNITAAAVPLFDAATPANTWRLRDAVDFEFPRNITLPANGRLLLVGFDPADAALLAAFRAKFTVPSAVPVLGPWNGHLDSNGESVELVKPDLAQLPPEPDAGFVPEILVDRVRYSPLPPWPNADGNGLSLQRIALSGYGNEPANWRAAVPTPGQLNSPGPADSDGDGLPDAWELEYFGGLARDGSGDFDGDGLTDAEEFQAGTSPADAADALRVLSIAVDSAVRIQFNAVAGRSYTVQSRDSLNDVSWRKVADLPAQSVSGPAIVTDAIPLESGRFYRVVTPAQP